MERCAKNDINGVVNADVLVVSMEHIDYEYRGTWTEVGCALGLGKPVIIFSPNADKNKNALNIFYWHKLVTHVNDWEAVDEQLERLRVRL
jgi:nucleoside 2-deoxyribosyltransferase